jgi:hypothetical protein
MKRILIITSFVLSLIAQISLAQTRPAGEKWKQIESIKIGFFTKKLNLTTEESQKFWPVYNQYQHELYKLTKQKKEAREQNASNPDQSIDDDFDFDTKILNHKKKYRLEFGKILSAEKVKTFYIAEREFKEELIKQLKNRSDNNQ